MSVWPLIFSSFVSRGREGPPGPGGREPIMIDKVILIGGLVVLFIATLVNVWFTENKREPLDEAEQETMDRWWEEIVSDLD